MTSNPSIRQPQQQHKPDLNVSKDPSLLDDGIVSAVKINGTWVVISRYHDDKWILVGGATNLNNGYRTILFKTIPAPFRETMRAILFRFIKQGASGTGRPPGVSLARGFYWDSVVFLRYIESLGFTRFQEIPPLVFSNYVHEQKNRITARGRKRSLSSLEKRFTAVERLFLLSQHTSDPISVHPWPDTSAKALSGNRQSRIRSLHAKTPLIPDQIFCSIFQHASEIVERAHYLLDLRDEIEQIESSQLGKYSKVSAISHHIRARGWTGRKKDLLMAIQEIRTACYIVVASLSGCRNHEIAYINSGCVFETTGEDGEQYLWMRTRSTKTEEGNTEWMIPEAAVLALRVMERWAIPYQLSLSTELASLRKTDPLNPAIGEAERHEKALFLGLHKGKCRTISLRSLAVSLVQFTKLHKIDWPLATHQFRRVFAHYAAHSQFGDLRYLKKHFKHWSIDMTLLYALSDAFEDSLFDEISAETLALREEKIDDWLKPGVPLSGGTGRSFMEYRGENPIVMFKNRTHMVRTVAENIELKSTGHSWCSAHLSHDCVGNGGLDRVRCSDCEHSIIELFQSRMWRGLHDHLRSLLKCDDIGDAVIQRLHRDIDRCAKVLRDLGQDPCLDEST